MIRPLGLTVKLPSRLVSGVLNTFFVGFVGQLSAWRVARGGIFKRFLSCCRSCGRLFWVFRYVDERAVSSMVYKGDTYCSCGYFDWLVDTGCVRVFFFLFFRTPVLLFFATASTALSFNGIGAEPRTGTCYYHYPSFTYVLASFA